MGTVLSEDQIRCLNRLRPPGTAVSDGLGTMLDQALAGMLPVDTISDAEIDWGTGAGQVSAADMPIADAGTFFTTDTVEAALQQIIAERNAVTDSASGADLLGATPITETGAAATVQSILEALVAVITCVADGVSGADYAGMTPLTETGAAATVQSVVEALVAMIRSDADGVAGADYTGATALPELGAQDTVQAVLERLVALLVGTDYGASGADFVGAYEISGWDGADVQTILESAKAYVDAAPKVIGYWFSSDGDLVASTGVQPLGLAHAAGAVTKAVFTLGETGADGTDALSLEGDVLINAVSVFSVKPALAKTATDGEWTEGAGTGVTVGVIDAAADAVVLNDVLTCEFTLTRTTPETEMADLHLYVEVTYPAP